jgi:hypothetical protein
MMAPSQLTLSLDNKKFCSYHAHNPNVYQAFKAKTLATIRKGFLHYGAKGIFELIRWETGISAAGDCFKINNSYTAFYARLFEEEFPEHKDFFRNRKSKFD